MPGKGTAPKSGEGRKQHVDPDSPLPRCDLLNPINRP